MLGGLCILLTSAVVSSAQQIPYEQYMSTLSGTGQKGVQTGAGDQELSYGNVLPETLLPWAMNGWAPVTDLSAGSWWFSALDHHFYGIRCTHQPSPWLGDYGQFRIASAIVDPAHQSATEFAIYDPYAVSTSFTPYLFQTKLLSYGTRGGFSTVSVAPTVRGAVLRFTFPPPDTRVPAANGYNQTRRILLALDRPDADTLSLGTEPGTGLITFSGSATSNGGGVPSNFAHYFYGTLAGGNGAVVSPVNAMSSGVLLNDSGLLWAFADFAANESASSTLVLRIATSFISLDQAKANYNAEVAGQSFDSVAAAAKTTWNALASRVSVNDLGPGYTPQQSSDLLTIFYSSLYRASKYPRSFTEIGASGETLHYSPYNGQVLPGELSTDVGFWDHYRTTVSLLSLVNPGRLATMMEGWLNAWREGGWVPQWSSPGYRGAMTGTMSDVSLSEAIVKLPPCNGTGGRSDDGGRRAAAAGYCVNASGLYSASRQNAFVAPGTNTSEGRLCLENYTTLGFVPSDACNAAVTRSVNYWHSDYALAQAASFLGEDADAVLLAARAANFSVLLEPTSGGFLMQRNSTGVFALSTFDEVAWSGGYTEAGPWQYRFEVPYDPQALKDALAALGVDACSLIQEANTMPSISRPGSNSWVTHEMAEMALNCWGQWELNNQPSWIMQHVQVAFDTRVNGTCARQAQVWLRQSASLFRPGATMFPGDEDNGSMGAWFILNALGIYALSPASGNFVIGSPLFANVSIYIDSASGNHLPLHILARNQSFSNVHVQSVQWNGVAINGVYVAYADLMQGGALEFSMEE